MRTQIEGYCKASNGKWFVKFVSYKGISGSEYVCSNVESGAVFETENEAYAGGTRALITLDATGRYPNMCEQF